MVQITLEHGATCYTPAILGLWGSHVADYYDELKECAEMGDIVLKMSEEQEEMEGKGFCVMVVHICCYHLKYPLFDSLEPSLEGFRLARDNGDIAAAAFCLQLHGMLAAAIGMPLDLYLPQIKSKYIVPELCV